MTQDVREIAAGTRFYIERGDAFTYSIETVPAEPSALDRRHHLKTYPSREAALNAYINDLEGIRRKLMDALQRARKKRRRWDHRTARRETPRNHLLSGEKA